MPAKLLVAVILTWGVGLFGVGRAMGQGVGQCSIGAPGEGSFGVNRKVGAPFTQPPESASSRSRQMVMQYVRTLVFTKREAAWVRPGMNRRSDASWMKMER
jgi:hypothetical protein